MSSLLTPTTLVRTSQGLARFGQVDISEVQEVRIDGEWLPIEEFTGCAGLATVTAVAPPADARASLKKAKKKQPRSVIEDFLGETDDAREEEEPDPTSSSAPPPAATAPTAVPASAPAPAAAPSNTDVVEAKSCLRIDRSVAEALMAGYAVNVRGVLLEPTFAKPRAVVPFQEGAPAPHAAPQGRPPVNVDAAVAAVVSAPTSAVTESVSLEALQPPPTAPAPYVRRFELGRMTPGQA